MAILFRPQFDKPSESTFLSIYWFAWKIKHISVSLQFHQNVIFIASYCYVTWFHFRNIDAGYKVLYFDGLVQERHNSIANALKLHLSCTNPSIWCFIWAQAERKCNSRMIRNLKYPEVTVLKTQVSAKNSRTSVTGVRGPWLESSAPSCLNMRSPSCPSTPASGGPKAITGPPPPPPPPAPPSSAIQPPPAAAYSGTAKRSKFS